MKRTAARVDGNQAEVIAALRSAGASVECLHTIGRGVPDLLIGHNGVNLLLEVKNDSKCPSKRRLTSDEQAWHERWQGQVITVESVLQALSAIADIQQLNRTTLGITGALEFLRMREPLGARPVHAVVRRAHG